MAKEQRTPHQLPDKNSFNFLSILYLEARIDSSEFTMSKAFSGVGACAVVAGCMIDSFFAGELHLAIAVMAMVQPDAP